MFGSVLMAIEQLPIAGSERTPTVVPGPCKGPGWADGGIRMDHSSVYNVGIVTLVFTGITTLHQVILRIQLRLTVLSLLRTTEAIEEHTVEALQDYRKTKDKQKQEKLVRADSRRIFELEI